MHSYLNKLKAILDNTNDNIVLMDVNYKVLCLNETIKKTLVGYFGKELQEGDDYRDFVVEPIKNLFLTSFEKAKAGETVVVEHETKSENFSMWFEYKVNPVYDQQGILIGVALTATNIDQRKKAETELKKTEANLTSVFDNTDVGHMLLDRDLNIISYNSAFFKNYENATGIKIKKGVNLTEVLVPEKAKATLAVYTKLFESKKSITSETVFHHNNHTYYFNVSTYPVVENNEVQGFCISAVDITESRIQELERQHMLTDLIQRNRDLEQFAYIVSHNVRAPLTNILGLSSILSSNMEQADLEQFVTGIKKSSENLDDVLKDLNTILQTRREISEQKTNINLTTLTEKVIDSIRFLIRNTKTVINCNFKEVETIVSIKPFFQNIFYNLITNSIKYSKKDLAPRIDIWTERKDGEIKLHFSDNGTGIDLVRYHDQIFGLYKRFNFNVEGKGLGLFMVKTQVESLNGHIEVISTPGEGAHFIITFNETELNEE